MYCFYHSSSYILRHSREFPSDFFRVFFRYMLPPRERVSLVVQSPKSPHSTNSAFCYERDRHTTLSTTWTWWCWWWYLNTGLGEGNAKASISGSKSRNIYIYFFLFSLPFETHISHSLAALPAPNVHRPTCRKRETLFCELLRFLASSSSCEHKRRNHTNQQQWTLMMDSMLGPDSVNEASGGGFEKWKDWAASERKDEGVTTGHSQPPLIQQWWCCRKSSSS